MIQPPRKEWVIKINFLISQPKHMLCVLKRIVSMRWVYGVPKIYVKRDGSENNISFVYLELWVTCCHFIADVKVLARYTFVVTRY